MGATTHSNRAERARLVDAIGRGKHVKPEWNWRPVSVDPSIWRDLDRARQLAEYCVAPSLYQARLEELETELLLLESLGQSRKVRPMAARLFGTGGERLRDNGALTGLEAAHELLARVEPTDEPRTVPAASRDGTGLREMMLEFALSVGLHVAVRVDPGLIASAAVGERTVFIADRMFGAREARRLAVHEVYGHLVSAFNGRAQPLGVLAIGTAGSYGDQEGVSLYLEELAGLLDGSRQRTLAGRLLSTHAMHAGVGFADVANALVDEHQFSPVDAVTICERSFRGGGVSRDAVYLMSWLRVRTAVVEKQTTLAELQLGKVARSSVSELRRLGGEGLVRPPLYLSNLARSFGSTGSGTSSETSPPSLATSLTRLDAT